MEIDVKWAERMTKALIAFKEAAESAWDLLEGYGVTAEKLENVKAQIESGKMTRREGWNSLGLPAAEYPD